MTARGIRNNNPFNIREAKNDATNWLGERTTDDDPVFEEFTRPEDGIRAGIKTIRNYRRLYGIKTVRGIIDRFAPPHENDTRAYMLSVGGKLKVGPDEVLDLDDVDLLARLTKAIITHENGSCPYSDETILAGVRMALGTVAT
jgi:hypothetical protein